MLDLLDQMMVHFLFQWHNVIIGHMQHNIQSKRDHNHGGSLCMVYAKKPFQEACLYRW